MGIEGLDKIFNPKRIAVIGASNKEESVGYKLLNNLIGVGFRGFVYPVNPFSASVQGVTAYPSVKKIPWQADLGIVATPAHIVPQIVEECGESGVTGIIIISSGFSERGPEGKALEEEITKLKDKYNMRIIGPNCLGIMRPSLGLNATFANKAAMPGRIAFVSQSGALGASVLDWAAQANVGFSYFVSVGAMIDVDFSDLIDYFGVDPQTRSIVLYIEAIKDARRFMSAARRFAGTKPIIVTKAGRTPEGTKAAASHTGASAGEDAIYDAAFRRVGIVRVEQIADLFSCSEILAMQPAPKGPNLALITNAGGPGVMATDFLVSRGGRLVSLGNGTVNALDKVLPPYWSRSNPIDICDSATVETFRNVLEICFRDPEIDGFLVIYTPIGGANPTEAAKTLTEVSKNVSKPVLTSWLGEEDVREARDILRRNNIPTFPTPEQAISTFMYMVQYARNLELLYETPEELPMSLSADRRRLQQILKKATREGRESLREQESKKFLEAYGIPVAEAHVTETAKEPPIGNAGYRLMIRSKMDSLFGSVIVFGSGGLGAELFEDVSVGFPPLNQTLARRMMEQTKAYEFLKGTGERPPANTRLLEEILVKFSQLVVDFPQLREIEVNLLLINEAVAMVLSARMTLDPQYVSAEAPTYGHLVIRPYPRKYTTESLIRDGKKVLLRPVRPEDEPLVVGLFRTFSEETMRHRFFQVIKEITHEMIARYCNIDYDREITIVAERTVEGHKAIIGMSRLIVQPDGERGEVSVVVGDPWQNLGLGSKMLDNIVEISKDIGLKTVFGEVLAENTKIVHVCRKRGFEIKPLDEESYVVALDLTRPTDMQKGQSTIDAT